MAGARRRGPRSPRRGRRRRWKGGEPRAQHRDRRLAARSVRRAWLRSVTSIAALRGERASAERARALLKEADGLGRARSQRRGGHAPRPGRASALGPTCAERDRLREALAAAEQARSCGSRRRLQRPMRPSRRGSRPPGGATALHAAEARHRAGRGARAGGGAAHRERAPWRRRRARRAGAARRRRRRGGADAGRDRRSGEASALRCATSNRGDRSSPSSTTTTRGNARRSTATRWWSCRRARGARLPRRERAVRVIVNLAARARSSRFALGRKGRVPGGCLGDATGAPCHRARADRAGRAPARRRRGSGVARWPCDARHRQHHRRRRVDALMSASNPVAGGMSVSGPGREASDRSPRRGPPRGRGDRSRSPARELRHRRWLGSWRRRPRCARAWRRRCRDRFPGRSSIRNARGAPCRWRRARLDRPGE